MTVANPIPYLFFRLRLISAVRRLGVEARIRNGGTAEASPFRHDILFTRRNGRIYLHLPTKPGAMVFSARRAVATGLYFFSQSAPEITRLNLACSDGHEASAAQFGFSTRSDDVVALPDRYFIFRNGFSVERALSVANPVPWHQRREILTWRGAANGEGIHPQSWEDAANARVIQRARLCMLLRGITRTDVRLVGGQNNGRPFAAFEPFGITGSGRAETEWLGDKYAIDIDGWSNAWSNLIIRMHFGCCVLKVASADNYRQWWYDRLQPWEHFVPVRADMSDLLDSIEWVRSNDREAAAIAARGQELVRSMTLGSETAYGLRAIAEYWQRDKSGSSLQHHVVNSADRSSGRTKEELDA